MIDKNNIVAGIGNGYTISNFPFDQGNWLYNEKLNTQYNSEEANRLLIEAGWNYINNTWTKDGKILGFEITVDSSKPERVIVANTMANQYMNHGISVNVKQVSSSNYIQALNNKNYQTLITGIKLGYTPKLSVFFGENNIANYNNDRVMELLRIIKSTQDYSSQIENYNLIYDEYLNDFPYLFLYRETDLVVYNQTLCGKINPNSFSIFYNIEKWYRQ